MAGKHDSRSTPASARRLHQRRADQDHREAVEDRKREPRCPNKTPST